MKRKLEEDFVVEEDRKIVSSSHDASAVAHHQDLVSEVHGHVEILDSTFSSIEADRAVAKRAILIVFELTKNEEIVSLIVNSGAVPALVRQLQAPVYLDDCGSGLRPYEHEVEKGSVFTLGLLAIKPEHQQLVVDAGALPHLVNLLQRYIDGQKARAGNGVIWRAADAITNLAHENSCIKTRVRIEGVIPPLADLLAFSDAKVQKAAAASCEPLPLKMMKTKLRL